MDRCTFLCYITECGKGFNITKSINQSNGMYLYFFILSEFAKKRMYLILAGAKLSADDVWVKDDDVTQEGTLPEWLSWFQEQVTEQYSLKRQCRYSIRKNLGSTREINGGVELLPVPSSVKAYLQLEDFDRLMLRFQHFHVNSDDDF